MLVKPLIIADERIPYLQGCLERFFRVRLLDPGEIKSGSIKNADALIIRSVTKADEKLLDGSSVKVIATATIGDDHIDKSYCRQKGIKFSNAAGCNAEAVNQFVLSAMMSLNPGTRNPYRGKTLGIIGVGHIGSKLKILAEKLGMNVLLNDPPRERKEMKGVFVDLEEIRKRSDIISLHVPLIKKGQDKTYHLIDDHFFNSLNRKVILINTSRGEVVETSSLLKAIESGKIVQSIIDVWENEPEINRELLKLVDIATPHVAGYSKLGKINASKLSAEMILRFFSQRADVGKYVSDCYEHLGVRPLSFGLNLSYEDFRTKVEANYQIFEDSVKLKKSPENFASFRNEYIFRNEFVIPDQIN